MKDYLYYKEYDYTDHCHSKVLQKLREENKIYEPDDEFKEKMLEILSSVVFSTTYDDAKIEKAKRLEKELREYADSVGGLLICSADKGGVYSCMLRLEPPLIVLGTHPVAKMYEGLVRAYQIADLTFVDAVDGWLSFDFTLTLHHAPHLKEEE